MSSHCLRLQYGLVLKSIQMLIFTVVARTHPWRGHLPRQGCREGNLATLNSCKPRHIGGHTRKEVFMGFPPANNARSPDAGVKTPGQMHASWEAEVAVSMSTAA